MSPFQKIVRLTIILKLLRKGWGKERVATKFLISPRRLNQILRDHKLERRIR